MRIVRNTPDLLIIHDRAILPAVAVAIIAALFAALGGLAALYGDDEMTRMGGGLFLVIAVPLVGFALFIAREHTHVFDRREGILLRRVRGLIGPNETRTIPLDRIVGVDLRVEHEVADPDTYGLDLLITHAHGDDPARLPLRGYTSSDHPGALHAALEGWLFGGGGYR